MRWYQFTLKKPKRWSRRAKSDGSAVPKLKRVKISNLSPFMRLNRWFLIIFIPLILLYSYLVSIYFRLIQHWISDLFPSIFSSNAVMMVITFSFALKIGFYLWMLGNWIHFCCVHRKHAKRAIAHRCHLCPRCGYDLQSRIDDSQPCPECGQRISRREAVRIWARFIAG